MKGVVTAHSLMAQGRFTPLPGGALEAGWETTVDLPPNARICAVGLLKNMPVLWETHLAAIPEEARPRVPWRIVVVADGCRHEFVLYSRYVGTILPPAGAVKAWHVFAHIPEVGR